MELFGWLLSIVSIIGSVLIARMHWSGFVCWIAANAGWIIYDLHIHNYPQAVLFMVYLITATYGLIEWLRRKKHA